MKQRRCCCIEKLGVLCYDCREKALGLWVTKRSNIWKALDKASKSVAKWPESKRAAFEQTSGLKLTTPKSKCKKSAIPVSFFHIRSVRKGQCFVVTIHCSDNDGHTCGRAGKLYESDADYLWKCLVRQLPKKTRRLILGYLENERDAPVV